MAEQHTLSEKPQFYNLYITCNGKGTYIPHRIARILEFMYYIKWQTNVYTPRKARILEFMYYM